MSTLHSQTTKTRFFLFCLLVLALGCTQQAFGGGIKDRMLERLPVINELKSSGVIGENNKGFLEFLRTDPAHQQLVEAENSDRKTVYEAIAKKQNTTAAFVGERRAAQIAQRAAPGTMLQDTKGNWAAK